MIMPIDSKPKCDFITCFFGLGLVGKGECKGIYWHNNCPAFIDEDEALKKWEIENEKT